MFRPSIQRLTPSAVAVDFSRNFLRLHAFVCLTTATVTVFVYVQVLSGLDVEVSAASAVPAMRNYGIEHPEGTGDAELRFRASGRYRLSRRIGFESVQESFSGDWVLSVARMGEKLCREASFQK